MVVFDIKSASFPFITENDSTRRYLDFVINKLFIAEKMITKEQN